ncbi:hypothetical protein AVEN_159102-1 [Araneus ventricosus]|uniref:Uncharacterized protein n=1 Tax=Araneus ventricosus TaxID=182803 RepID=A0A4Y2B9R5_ARAVE|nr:hypothetical protein AVEN_159102-1 [Araneus ventricosus]
MNDHQLQYIDDGVNRIHVGRVLAFHEHLQLRLKDIRSLLYGPYPPVLTICVVVTPVYWSEVRLLPLMFRQCSYGTVSNFIDRTVAITRGVIIGTSQNWCRWKCHEETGLFGIFCSSHFHRHQFCEDPIITPRVIATVLSIKLLTVPWEH